MLFRRNLIFILAIFISSISYAATYNYTGPRFTEANGSYSTSDRITGQFTTANMLPNNMISTDISSSLQSYEFTDGVQTLNQSNSSIIGFTVSTDALGNPETWSITVWAAPVTTMSGGLVEGIGTFYTPGAKGLIQEDGFMDGSCGETNGPDGQCSSAAIGGTDSAGFFQVSPSAPAGMWTGGRVRVIPTLGIYGIIAFIISLLLIAFIFMNHRQKQFI